MLRQALGVLEVHVAQVQRGQVGGQVAAVQLQGRGGGAGRGTSAGGRAGEGRRVVSHKGRLNS